MALGGHLKRIRTAVKGLSVAKAAKLMQVDVERMRKWESRDADPAYEDMLKIEKYFDAKVKDIYNLDFFPIKDPVLARVLNVKIPVETVGVGTNVLTNEYKKTNIHSGDYPDEHLMPLFYFDKGIIDARFYDRTDLIKLYYSLPDFTDCKLAITNVGDDMAKLFKDGDSLLMQPVPDFYEINYGKPHFIITPRLALVRYLHTTADPLTWMLRPENQAYDTFQFPREKVLALFQVKGNISRNAF